VIPVLFYNLHDPRQIRPKIHAHRVGQDFRLIQRLSPAPARAPEFTRLSSAAVAPTVGGGGLFRLFDRRARRHLSLKIRHRPALRRSLQPRRLIARLRLRESRTLLWRRRLLILRNRVLRRLALRRWLRRILARRSR